MTARIQDIGPEDARQRSIVEIGLHSSSMLRVFAEGSKDVLFDKMMSVVRRVSQAESERQYRRIHSDVCSWGTTTIRTATRQRNGQTIKRSHPSSYGQIAKTVDISLKIAFYYCHFPGCKWPERIPKWLNAAVDTAMMIKLREWYPKEAKNWPGTLEMVDESIFESIQETIRDCIREERFGWCKGLTPVQFDDVLWRNLNRPSLM